MKSYCSRNNLVAMGWFLVILGLVITSGVDGGWLPKAKPNPNLRFLESEAPYLRRVIEAKEKQDAAFKRLVKKWEFIKQLIDPRNLADYCKAAKLLKEDIRAETLKRYIPERNLLRIDKICAGITHSPPSMYN